MSTHIRPVLHVIKMPAQAIENKLINILRLNLTSKPSTAKYRCAFLLRRVNVNEKT